MRRPALLVGVLLAISLAVAGVGSVAHAIPVEATQHSVVANPADPAERDTSQPNVILIKTDDQVYDNPATMRQYMPNLVGYMTGNGVTYTHSYVSSPSCCQSRASTFVGRFPHNEGVKSQGLGHILDTRGSIAAYLRRAGYRTGLYGKYLNLLKNPPGFDDYVTIGGSCPSGTSGGEDCSADGGIGWYYNFIATTKAGSQKIPGNPTTGQNYLGTWLGAKATTFLTASLRDEDTPFYLEYDPITPHTHDTDLATTMVEPKYRGSTVPACTRTVPEADRSDKPSFVQARDQTNVTFSWKTICPTAQRALKTIDDWFADTVGTLQAAGELNNTLIIFTSDNGLMHGQHGLQHKFVAYEPSIRVPLMISYPGLFAPGQPTAAHAGTAKVSNIDILPTILDVAGINPAPALPVIDGRSLAAHPRGHDVILSEYWQDNRWASHVPTPFPTWASLIDGRYKFIVTYSDVAGTTPVTQELYDETNDPAENTNLIPLRYGSPSPSFNVAAWAAKLNTQRHCVGATCN